MLLQVSGDTETPAGVQLDYCEEAVKKEVCDRGQLIIGSEISQII